MSDNNMNQGPIAPGKHHVSKTYIPLMLFKGFWSAIFLVAIGAINIIGSADSIYDYIQLRNLPAMIIGGLILILAIFTIFIWISYKRLTWEVTDDEIHIYKGIFVRKKSHIPFRRIHSMDIEAKILERIFGVVTVKLDTAAGSAGTDDAKIPALSLSTAENLRTEIFKRKESALNSQRAETLKGGGNILEPLNRENDNIRGLFAGEATNDTVAESEYRLTNKELVLLCLSNGKAFAIIAASLYFIFEFIGFLRDVDENLGQTTDAMFDNVLSMGPLVIFFIAIIALVISMVVSFVTRALTYGNFVVKRYNKRVQVSRGLLQKVSTGVSVERIQTLIVKQGLIQRILGYAEISLETASGMSKSSNEQEKRTGVIIHPYIKVSRIDDYMDKLLSEFSDRPIELKGLSMRAMRRSMVRYGLWTLLLVLLPVNLFWYFMKGYIYADVNIPIEITAIDNTVWGTSIFILALMVVIGWLAWKGRAFSKNDKYLAIRKGVLGRTRVYVPKNKIQFAVVAQNPFQKMVELTTLKANTAAMGSSNQSIKDLEKNISNDYLNWVEHK